MLKNLSRSLARSSLLLFLVSAVGLLGLNGSLDPRNVTRIQAHDIVIQLTSNSGNTLSFGVSANCVSSAMAPSDQCVANVELQNTGEGDYTLTAPDVQTSGALTTCGGGGWFSASVSNLSYAPNSHVVRVGDIETFNVNTSLSIDTPNECQGQSALIVITLVANATDSGEEPATPVATATPTGGDCCDLVTPQATSEVAGSRATPEPTSTPRATATARTATPVATFTSEVLPSRFPSTGQGGSLGGTATDILRVIFLGVGLVAAGLLITALALRAQDRSRS